MQKMRDLFRSAAALVVGGFVFLMPAPGCTSDDPTPETDSAYTPEARVTTTSSAYTPTTGTGPDSASTMTTEDSSPAPSTTDRPDYDVPPPQYCCKYCGPDSKACGDSCIANVLNCHKPAGCACEGVLPQ